MPHNLEQPLGQHLKPPAPSRWRLSRGAVIWTVAGVALIGAAGFLALQDSGLRRPEPAPAQVAEAGDDASAAAETDTAAQAGEPVEAEPQGSDIASEPGSAKIIKVEPAETPGSGPIIIRNPAAAAFNPLTAHLPERALLEDSPYGPLPKRASDGRRPLDVYARPWSGARGARVAIVIGGLGVSQTGTQRAIASLPPEVTLAFASQGNSISRWMAEARRSGHEILMQLPMEPFDFPQVNPGRDTLLVDDVGQENTDKLHRVLAKTTNYTGVVNYLGARFTAEPAVMAPLVEELAQRGLLYLDDGTSARSVADRLAKEKGTAFAAADTTIDAQRDRGAVLAKLDELERTARAKGFAIGTGSAFDTTVEAVASWVAEATKRGIEIVPVSALVNDPER